MKDKSETTENKHSSIKTSFFNYNNRMSKFVMDLINSNNPIHVLNDKYVEYEAYRLNITVETIKVNNYIGYVTDYSEDLRKLAENMVSMYKEMLVTVFEGASQSKDLQKRIEASLIKPKICWKTKGQTGSLLEGNFIKVKSNDDKYTFIKLNKDSAKVLFTLATNAFIEAFDMFTYKTPSGYNYFGKCERCGQYFSKARSKQKFCGTKCKNAAGQASYRENIKKQ